MFELARRILEGAIVVLRKATAADARLTVVRIGVVPEGAAATAVAAALTGRAGVGPIACVASRGHVDPRTLITVFLGGTPP